VVAGGVVEGGVAAGGVLGAGCSVAGGTPCVVDSSVSLQAARPKRAIAEADPIRSFFISSLRGCVHAKRPLARITVWQTLLEKGCSVTKRFGLFQAARQSPAIVYGWQSI